jgi:hypothetical protein
MWNTRIIFTSALVFILAYVGMRALTGCSQQQIQQGLRNVSAADCSTAATQQAFINNLPGQLFVTPAQEAAILAQLCYAEFGAVPAPITAPGNVPMIPAAPAIVLPHAATPAPAL